MIWLLQRFVCFLIVTIKTMVWVLLLDFFESPSWVLSQLLCLLWIVKSFCWSSCTLISHTSHMKKTHHLASLKSCWWFELHIQKTKQKQEVNKKPGDHGNLTEGKTEIIGEKETANRWWQWQEVTHGSLFSCVKIITLISANHFLSKILTKAKQKYF